MIQRQIFVALAALLVIQFGHRTNAIAQEVGDSLSREVTHLNSMKEGLRREVENLKSANQAKLAAIESEIQKFESLRIRQASELDAVEADLQSLQNRMKASGTLSAVESSSRELKKAITSFEGRSSRSVSVSKVVSSETALSRFLDGFSEAREVLKRSGEIRDEARGFALVSGETVQGKVKWIGETAAIGVSEGKMAPLSPDGKGGWKALRPLQEQLTSLVVFSNLKDTIDTGVSANLGDRALGLVPILWLGLLGVAVSWLFALIARN